MSTLPVNSEFGNYHIIRHIGGGGMAQIYQAKTQGLAGFEKHLALKVINPEYANEQRFIQMLIDEAKITVGLSHVNIVQVFDLGQCNGIYYIAMEYVDGLDVLELVNGLHGLGERVPIEAVAYVGRQICSGLHYAHSRKDKEGKPLNIVHRDISPQNILCSRGGEVKVVDFGIAKAAGMSSKTQAGVIKGKVNYMAPEQVLGQKADSRTDIFAVGIVLWECLTSQMVYSAENMGELVAAVRKADIPPPSTVRAEIPAPLDRIIMHALDPNPKERAQNAHELQVELTRFLSTHAPNYGGSNLASLVEQVLTPKDSTQQAKAEKVPSALSREERLEDHNSLIFSVADGEAQLIVEIDGKEQVYPLGEGLTLGRAGEVAIADARASRQHARISLKGTTYVVEDLGSSNGTFVNDKRITEPVVLQLNDRMRIGGCHIRFVFAPPAAQPSQPSIQEAGEPASARSTVLVIKSGKTGYERELNGDAELTYRLRVGPFQLAGSSGRVVRKNDGYWLEPTRGRNTVTVNGKKTSRPVRLSVGDSFMVDSITFTLTEQ